MSSEKNSGISPFQRYLSLWVFLCMVAGVLVGHFLPSVPRFLDRLQIDGISIPIAILIWIMIYPMMMKVDFQSIREVGRHPKGLFVTWITNWLIKPFTMYALAAFFFFHVFQAFIPQDLATQYLAGAVLLGAAPCTAMVFVWSTLTKGDPAYTVVQVATNDLIILAAFVPIVKFLLGVSHVTVPYSVLFLSIFLFVVIPLAGGILTRMTVIRQKGEAYFNQVFIHKFDQATTWGLLLTLVIIFSSQAQVILSNPFHILLIAIPLVLQTYLIFAIASIVFLIIWYLLMIKVLRCNIEPLRNADFTEYEEKLQEPLTPFQSALLKIVVLFVAGIVFVGVLGSAKGGAFAQLLNNIGIYGVAAITLALMIVIRIQGQPLLDLKKAAAGMQWDFVFLYAMAMVISRQKAAQQGTRTSTRQDAASTQQAIKVKASREFRLNRPLNRLPSPSSIR